MTAFFAKTIGGTMGLLSEMAVSPFKPRWRVVFNVPVQVDGGDLGDLCCVMSRTAVWYARILVITAAIKC